MKCIKIQGAQLCKGIWILLVVISAGFVNAYAQNDEAALAEMYKKQALSQPQTVGENAATSKLKTVITLTEGQQNLITALESIARQAGLKLSYSKQFIPLNKYIHIEEPIATAEKALWDVLEDTHFRFGISSSGQLVLLRRQQPESKQVIQETVTGNVTDAQSGETLPGVNILVKGTTMGASTDQNGSYKLTVQSLQDTLVFTYIGYQRQEVSINGRQEVNVSLQPQAIAGEELVVVGYGEQKEINLTGAVDVVSNDQIESRQSSTVSQILQGQSPGLDFSVGRSGFEPGASMDINIRGIGSLNGGSPYVLIDGFPGEMDRLNPEDIESVSVLKDAAASAIYGARAPYGVILITTKNGRKNEELTVSYSGNVLVNTPDRLPEMLDSYTFARVTNEMGDNGGGRAYSNEMIERIIAYQNEDWNYLKQLVPEDATHYETAPLPSGRWGQGPDSHADYDWYDEYFGHSLNHRHNLSVRGGSETTSYYLSAGFLDQKGVLNYGTDTYKRYNLTGKINTSVTGWWDVRYETRFMKSPRERFNSENGTTGTGYDLFFRQISRTMPTQAKYDGYGNYAVISKIPAIEGRGTDKIETTENWHTLATELRPLEGWEINADFAYSSVGIDRSNRNLTINEPYSDGRVVPLSFTVPNYIEQVQNNDYYWVSNAYTSYDWNIDESHRVFAMLGMQYEYNKAHRMSASKTDLIMQDVPSLETATGDAIASERSIHWSTQGYFTRLMYNYREKYLFEANARYDGTSRFQKGSRWGFFPSFSVGWNLDKENFWQPIQPYINTLKLRGSWGQLGNQQVTPYQDMSLIPLQTGKLNWLFNHNDNRPVGYASTPGLVSPNLSWETATTKNLGFDLTFLDHRLQMDIDLYERITEGMIGPSEPVPGVLGSSVPQSNNATLRSRGWEASLRWDHAIRGSDFSYFFGLNIHDAKTVVMDYLNPSGLISDWYSGKEVGEIWGYTANELFQSQEEVDAYTEQVDLSFIFNNWNPGDLKYEDVNGDGAVNVGSNSLNDHGDLSIIGNNTPRYQFGLTGGFKFKEYDFSFLIKGTAKRDYFFPTGANNIRFWGVHWLPFTSMTPAHLDYFRDHPGDENVGLHEGDANINRDAYWPKPYLDTNQNAKNRHASTRYLVDASYLRLQNIQLGYSLPQSVLSKLNLRKVRVYFSGENLFTITGLLKGIDPIAIEGYGGGASATYGTDRILSMGATITF